MNKTLKSGLIALVLTMATMFLFFAFFRGNDFNEALEVNDSSAPFSFGWPLEAGNGSSGGIGGGLDITFNKLNLGLDFLLFALIYFSLLNFKYNSKSKSRSKDKKK